MTYHFRQWLFVVLLLWTTFWGGALVGNILRWGAE